ncbi:PLP-dependent transferase [Marasmius fiardii PR-910]|nr:PLP-dependent transferase [Marasmius fiardii PR-910]
MSEKVNPISTSVTHSDGIPVDTAMVEKPITTCDVQSLNGIVRYRPEIYYAQFMSELALRRKPSAIHELVPLEQTPGVVSLLAGKPNAGTFPFTEVKFTVKDPYRRGSESVDVSVTVNGGLLAEGLQYTSTPGIGGLISWFERLQERVHGRKASVEGWRISVGCGSRELVRKAIEAFINPGGLVMVDVHTKPHLDRIATFGIHSCQVVDIQADSFGIIPSSLEYILETWTTNPRPKVLYTIPFGVGSETSRERKLEILRISKKWDIIVLEDDPYYYLSSPSKRAECPSYFSLEKELEGEIGHVLRFDTLSTTIAPGLGLGWISGPEALVHAVDTYTSSANLQAPTVSQAFALALLCAWGHEGFLSYVERFSV